MNKAIDKSEFEGAARPSRMSRSALNGLRDNSNHDTCSRQLLLGGLNLLSVMSREPAIYGFFQIMVRLSSSKCGRIAFETSHAHSLDVFPFTFSDDTVTLSSNGLQELAYHVEAVNDMGELASTTWALTEGLETMREVFLEDQSYHMWMDEVLDRIINCNNERGIFIEKGD